MAQNKPSIPASVVTPQRSCLRTMSQHRKSEECESKRGSTKEQPNAIPSRRKARVFRCLSNTSTHNSQSSPASSARSQAQRSELKSLFQPPTSKLGRHANRKHPKEGGRQAPVPAVFLGNRVGGPSLSPRPLKRNTSAKSASGEPVHNKKMVHFNTTVRVVCIPSHRSYPKQVKKVLWGSMKEIKSNAIRNTAEYIYDKCNWRNSTEEDQFYRDTRNGSLIHPVHVQRYYAAMKKMQEEKNRKHEEKELVPVHRQEEEARSSRKRIRCCSPSPIRRSHLHSTSADNEQERATKRRRCILPVAPQSHSSSYYSPQPPQRPVYSPYSMHHQQENYYGYPQNAMAMTMQSSYPFPGQPLPPSEIA